MKDEFFDLAKLLNENLVRLRNLNDEFIDTSQGLELFIDPDNRMLKAKAPKRLSITTLEEWTNTFGTYVSIIVSRFPSRATELIAHMGIIREAATDSPGLGVVIYDYKFRMKAAADKSIYWGCTDSQLWLRIF